MLLRKLRLSEFHASSLVHSLLLTRAFSSQQNFREPLRILFCGSDNFSITSLEAIHEEHKRDPFSIASIDVVCRPPKRVGRGLKTIREVPIANMARDLSLDLYEVDTFTGWTPPMPGGSPINLIIAVSFGRLVPSRVLNNARYGGLNVHPSMLPDFHGPAPLHHTLLSNCSHTGVTLQTMHPQHFDQGVILDQTPFPGLEHKSRTVPELSAELAPLGAEMLVRAIRNRSFVILREMADPKQPVRGGLARHAPKITPKDSHIDWSTWTSNDILHKQNIIGPLWNNVNQPRPDGPQERRVIWSSGFSKARLMLAAEPDSKPGIPYMIADSDEQSNVCVDTVDGQVLQVERVKLDGERERNSTAAFRSLGSRQTKSLHVNEGLASKP